VVLVVAVWSGGAARAAQPAVIKPYGMTIPFFFFSASEQRARCLR